MQDFVHQNGDLVLDLLWYAQPMEADKHVADVVRSTEMVRKFCSRVQHRLEWTNQVDWKPNQHAVAVIQTRYH